MEKLFIKANELLEDSFHLAWKIYESGYKPNYIVGVWRGRRTGWNCSSRVFKCSWFKFRSYCNKNFLLLGIDERRDKVQVYGLNYVINKVKAADKLLVVDDVHDTGNSINQIILDLREACKENTPEIKVATPYFKPNKTKQIDTLISLFMKRINGLFFPRTRRT